MTGTTSELYGTRTFRGDGTSSPQVFHVSGRELGSPTQAVAIRFANIPTGAPVIITVEGAAPEAYPAGFFTDAEPGQIAFGDPRFAEVATHTMWNFADAASLTIGTGDQFLGSVLVPRATAHSTITASTNGRVLIGGDLDFSGDGNEAHSYPFPDPDFECKPEILPPPATGRLAVQKVVVDSAGVVDPARTYAGTYSCRSAQGDPIPGSFWTVRSGGAPQIIASNLAVGSVCTLAELPPPPPDADDPSSVWQPVSITPSTVTIGTDTTSVVTVTNTVARATGSFRIQKTLSDPGSAVPPGRVFTGTSSCQLLGRDVTPADNTWSVTAGGPAAVVGPVPVGAVCEVRETLGSAPDPAAPGLGWGPTLVSPSSIVVGSGATPTVTVQNSVVPVAGSFSIVKTFSGVGSGYDPAALFDFSYSCKAPGQPAGAPVDVRLAAGQQRTVSGVAAGSTCAVTEGIEPPTSDPSYEWQDPEVSVSDPAATVSGRTATFTVAPGTSPAVQVSFVDTLLRQTGDFAVQKVTIDPRRIVDPTRAFTGDWNCEYAGSQVAGGRWTVRANEGAALLATQLPLGTTCVANEDLQISPPDPAEPRFTWAASSSTRSSTPVAPGAVAVVTLTNVVTERLAAASIVKVVDDAAGTAPAGARYSGTVVCSPPAAALR
ncbi:hypothetical protein GCM10025867_22380 [Frondihabitans sucicola]|uniref:Choice-of-anchor A family protein n=1 Tax=Frondihabitans sucicola TaxID=1268041 RepID=A0ABM8GP40_9MICO|nr:DUF5979 domain-containing protein [Frondihabitans sucicola]BDZ49997.1 hypothetical protein GCM10025867_22380 [Frondihabitans sucicola]